MTIKLLREKKDIYWEDSLEGEKPFCTKGTWYEVISSTKEYLTFKNDRGDEEIFLDKILDGAFEMTNYSNQKETPPKKVKPSKEDRPYENWKMSINEKKWYRCVADTCSTEVEGLRGFINPTTNMFYYCVKRNEYLCAKVYPFQYPDGETGYEFVKENKDSKGYLPKSNPVTEDKYEFNPDAIWKNFKLDIDYIGSGVCGQDTEDMGNVLASFGVPEDTAGEDNIEVETSSDVYDLADSLMSQQSIKSDGGKSDYYKIELPEWLLEKQSENGFIMLEDLAEVLFNNDFNFTNVFKAQKRMYELKKGRGKAGNDFEYDANKCKYYVDKQVEVEGRG